MQNPHWRGNKESGAYCSCQRKYAVRASSTRIVFNFLKNVSLFVLPAENKLFPVVKTTERQCYLITGKSFEPRMAGAASCSPISIVGLSGFLR